MLKLEVLSAVKEVIYFLFFELNTETAESPGCQRKTPINNWGAGGFN